LYSIFQRGTLTEGPRHISIHHARFTVHGPVSMVVQAALLSHSPKRIASRNYTMPPSVVEYMLGTIPSSKSQHPPIERQYFLLQEPRPTRSPEEKRDVEGNEASPIIIAHESQTPQSPFQKESPKRQPLTTSQSIPLILLSSHSSSFSSPNLLTTCAKTTHLERYKVR